MNANILVCGECGADFKRQELWRYPHPDRGEVLLCPECGNEYVVLLENGNRKVSRKIPIQRLFARFHNAHPEVYDFLVEQARKMLKKGHDNGSIRLLYDLARWHFEIEMDPDEDFKLNDWYHSRYARLIMAHEEDLRGFFELRKLRAK